MPYRQHHRPSRRTRAAAVVLAVGALGSVAPPAGAASTAVTSANWAGYVAKRASGFTRVAATWTVPAVTCSAGRRTYSASWVGLGGYHSASAALEQAGTESDCNADGSASYSAWYEVVPAVGHDFKISVRPGDSVSVSVVVSGKTVRARLADRTTGKVVSKTVHATSVDRTSAEWIVEAPSLCSGSSVTASCEQSALADFGTTAFSDTSATTKYGHTGTLADSAWSTLAVTLRSDRGPRSRDATAGASPSDISGDGFSVAYG